MERGTWKELGPQSAERYCREWQARRYAAAPLRLWLVAASTRSVLRRLWMTTQAGRGNIWRHCLDPPVNGKGDVSAVSKLISESQLSDRHFSAVVDARRRFGFT